MNFKIDLLLLVVACVGYAVTQEASSELPAPTSPPTTTPGITAEKNTSSSTASSTTVTTTDPSSTSSHGSSSTTPHTTAKPNSTTTLPPTSTTTHLPASTTHGPTPAPPPTDMWGVKFNETYCILVKAEISIEFKYMSKATNKTATTSVSVPAYGYTTANGTCGSEKQTIHIRFFNNWVLTLVFKRSNDSQSYHQSEVSLVWDLKDSPITDAPNLSGEDRNLKPMFDTSKPGYLCMARMTLYDNTTADEGLLAIYTKNLHLEAFQKSTTAKFSEQYERCKEDTISNLVPIIVGACLGGLIIIVLIAYLIGRKRSRRGYESV
uniref:Lysosome-associated membrane glycoprotein 5 n=1 Tax=Lumbricus rubellus TaxID=35632 RepID=Q9U5N4_LUMRU|nr:lysosomal membrane glycoprotein [Lumbricus rubellus]